MALRIEKPGEHKEVKKDEWQKNPPHLEGVPDMSALIYLEAPNILHNMEVRYKRDQIYTSISKVMIAVNPYKFFSVDIYRPELIQEYRDNAKKLRQTLPPHVFSVSQAALFNMLKYQANQSMVVCGESGSGKTESAKQLMRYLAYRDPRQKMDETGGRDKSQNIEQQVLDANPILEAFGNAKTLLNNNSSRFGKFTKIVFAAKQEKIVGSFIETYLLEKSRVVRQEKGERNYHIFYQLTSKGMSAAKLAEYRLTSPKDFHYTNQSDCWEVDGISDPERLKEMLDAMNTVNFKDQDKDEIFRLIAGVLWLGNVTFDSITDDSVKISAAGDSALTNAAYLFGISKDEFSKRLTTRSINIRGQVIIKPLSKSEAEFNRDAIAKALYNGNFRWIVSRMNDELFDPRSRLPDVKWIGILDVFGFESFENNSFEQFCINFCNERLQQFFNGYILQSEQDEYRLEAIMWVPIKVPNNQDCIDLIDKRPSGILSILDSACKMPKANDEVFVRNLFSLHNFHPRLKPVKRITPKGSKGFININGFSIRHYAGEVVYNALEFLFKNADSTHPDTIALFATSTHTAMTKVLQEEDEVSAKRIREATGGQPQTQSKSTGMYFSDQLSTLMNLLYDTTPYFVRCIKPNRLQKPGIFEWEKVQPQLECGGIIEALRILKCGYPTRCTYDMIFERYGSILKPTPPNLNKRDFCEAVLRNCGDTLDRSEFQLGLSKVFFRPGKQEFLENLLASGTDLPAATIEKIKRFLVNKRFQRGRGAIRVHIMFALRLTRVRAFKRIHRAARVVNVICGTMMACLKRVRKRLGARALQAYVRCTMVERRVWARKHAAMLIGNYFMHNHRRIALRNEVSKRIAHKRQLLDDAKRAEKLKQEKELRDRLAAESAERERKRDEERKKQQEKEDRLRREEEERERERQEKQRLEMEEREAARQRAQQEREEHEAQEREKAVQDRVNREVHLQLENIKAKERQLTADPMEELLLRGGHFLLHDTTNRVPVTLRVSNGGLLSWKKRQGDKKDEQGEDLGSLDLADISKIKSVPNPDAHDNVNSVNLISISVRFPAADNSGNFEEFELDLEAESRPQHKEWLVALGYGTRNIKELQTLSRPEGDPARGNALAAEYMDRIIGLLEQRDMADHLHTHEGGAAHAAVASELEAAKRGAGQSLAIDVNHPVVQASSSLLLKERKRMESSTGAGKVEEMQRALMELAMKNAELEQELEKYRKMAGGAPGVTNRASIGGDEAKKLILAAEAELKAAQSVVDERQHKIDAALKKVNEAEKARKNTLATMTMLAIPQDPSVAPEDPTGQRLRKLLSEQTLALEQAKYALDVEVTTLVNEEKDLRRREQEYDTKVRSATGQSAPKQIGFRNIANKPSAKSAAAKGGPVKPAKAGAVPQKEGDDGCVIS